MSFFEAVRTCMVEKYARFSGRATRAEYWWFYLFTFLVIMGAVTLMVIGAVLEEMQMGNDLVNLSLIFFGLLVTFSLIIPSIAATVRRLHDTGRSGWWYFVSFIPYVGDIILIVFCCLPSESGENEYGEEWTEDA